MLREQWIVLIMFRSIASAAGLHFVIGMVGRDSNGNAVDGIAKQTETALRRIEAELVTVGRDRSAIVRLRFYVVDMRLWPMARDVVNEFFSGSIPPSTAVGVTGLVEPQILIEIDAEASAGGAAPN
jgi:enamine deaminase RidA (YjgF/YER057c/UK114 family)